MVLNSAVSSCDIQTLALMRRQMRLPLLPTIPQLLLNKGSGIKDIRWQIHCLNFNEFNLVSEMFFFLY